MTTWTPTPIQQSLLDRLRGYRLFMAFPHPTRPGWVELIGRECLAGVTVATRLDVLLVARTQAAEVAQELLETQRELDHPAAVHLVLGNWTDCGRPAEGLAITLVRDEATCPKCLGVKPAPELRINPEVVHRDMGQQHDLEAAATVDPSATVEEPYQLVDVDAFLVGLGEVASATRDLAEAQAAVDRCSPGDGEEAVEKLIEEVTAKLRERLKLLDVGNGDPSAQ